MWVYQSDFVTVTFGAKTTILPRAFTLGAVGAMADLRTDPTKVNGWCIVGSSVQLADPLPNGITLWLDTATDLDNPVPNQARTRINQALATNIPNGATWREAIRALYTDEGKGKWGTEVGTLRLIFDTAGDIDF